LHALSTPPAFILDQDQILKNSLNFLENLATIFRAQHRDCEAITGAVAQKSNWPRARAKLGAGHNSVAKNSLNF